MNCYTLYLWAIHKGRPHPRGKGISQKPTHADAGGGGQLQKADVLDCSNLNFYQNFRSLNSVLATRLHLTQQLIIQILITDVSELFALKFNSLIDLLPSLSCFYGLSLG